jgi:hypothetical protein
MGQEPKFSSWVKPHEQGCISSLRNNTKGLGRQIQRAQTHCSFAADTNSFTLSRQRENIAALGVEWLGRWWVFRLGDHRLKSILQRLPASESGFDIMPPFDAVTLVCFPA